LVDIPAGYSFAIQDIGLITEKGLKFFLQVLQESGMQAHAGDLR
jgi:hypothetical protein